VVVLLEVAMLRVLVREVVPAIVTEVGLRAQVGMEVAPEGPVTAQVSATAPVNPPPGVMVMALVPEPPGARAMAAPLTVRLGDAAWVIATVTKSLAGAKVVLDAGGA